MVTSVEALFRWPQADGATALPESFMPLAEETGLSDALSNLTLEQAVMQAAARDAAASCGEPELGVPSTLTHKVVPKGEAVSAGVAELESGSGGVWGNGLPSAEDIGLQAERDLRRSEAAPDAYSVLRGGRGDPERGPG